MDVLVFLLLSAIPPQSSGSSPNVHSLAQVPRRRLLSAVVGGGLWAACAPPTLAAGFLESLRGGPEVELLTAPRVCQSRVLPDDFVMVRYVAKQGDVILDDRYASTPLVFQLGAFYLPGVAEALEGKCVQSQLRLTWNRPPAINWGVNSDRLTSGPLVCDLTLDRVMYDAFQMKMVDNGSTKFFAQTPLSADCPLDTRWYANDRPAEPPGQTLAEFFELAI